MYLGKIGPVWDMMLAAHTVIKKITFDTVVLIKYLMEGGRVKKETVTLKVDTEG